MWITRLHNFLTTSTTNKSSPRIIFWFSLSLTFAAIYGILALQKAFSGEYVIQDDARQHIFWMRRFLDPGAFPNDLIADYFQSVAPLGYTTLYRLMAVMGIDPILLSKLLPVLLGLITTGYCFGVCLQLLPVPFGGFIAALLLNQNLWMQDGLVSGTPKAFLYPLLLAFLYYLLKRSQIGVGVAIALLGLFYPSLVLICAGTLILQLLQFDRGKPYLSKNRKDYYFCATGLGVAVLALLPYAVGSSEFGPVITTAQARALPEFLAGGRASFFHDNDPWRFWFNAGRSGIRLPSALMPTLVYGGLLLPILLRFSSRFPLAKKVSSNVILLPQLILVSLAMFFAAHALLFKLHLPSRYTQHTLRIVLVVATGIALVILLDTIFQWAGNRQGKTQTAIGEKQTYSPTFSGRSILALGAASLLIATLILYPMSLKSFPWTGYVMGEMPALYKFFQQQPKDILIASLSEEVNNLPSFSQHSIFVGSEYAIPYHLGYYQQFRQRTLDLINAQYSPDSGVVRDFIQKYGIDFWLLEPTAFTPESITNNRWIRDHQPVATQAVEQLQQGKKPALANLRQRCAVFESQGLVVQEASCILKTLPN